MLQSSIMGKCSFFIIIAICVSCGKGVGNSLGGSSIGVDQVSINETDISVYVGKKSQLYSSVVPSDAQNTSIWWESSDASIVTVSDSGQLTGISVGAAIVTAIAEGDGKSAQCNVTVVAFPVIQEVANADSVTYTLPGSTIFKTVITPVTADGIKYPTGTDDSGSYSVPKRFRIAETETTYALWKEVYDWATDPERGANIYCFANSGIKGGYSGGTPVLTEKNPVTSVTWRDSIVWCNALTEYYNANNGTSDDLVCVYTYNGALVRDSRDTAAVSCDNVVQNTTANGFRLPSISEWEFAARYIGVSLPSHLNYVLMDGYYYTKGGSVSGYTGVDDTGNDYSVSWSETRTTLEVKSRKPNILGLYDMSWNVWEWRFDASIIIDDCTTRFILGGSFDDSFADSHVGVESEDAPYIVDLSYGFRVVRNNN